MDKDIKKNNTREEILKVSEKLFLEKGFDNTTINDIVDNLEGKTKGSIYYHFSSKRDILNSLVNNNLHFEKCDYRRDINATKKMNNILLDILEPNNETSSINWAPKMINSPVLIGEYYLNLMKLKDNFLRELHDGIIENDVETEYIEEIIELLGIYMNLCIGINFPKLSKEKFIKKIAFISEIAESYGVTSFDKKVMKQVDKLCETYEWQA